jgi:hypothetical protein
MSAKCGNDKRDIRSLSEKEDDLKKIPREVKHTPLQPEVQIYSQWLAFELKLRLLRQSEHIQCIDIVSRRVIRLPEWLTMCEGLCRNRAWDTAHRLLRILTPVLPDHPLLRPLRNDL